MKGNKGKLVFVNSFKDIVDTWHIKGSVQNTSPNQQDFLSVTATIYNLQQQPIDTENGYATVGGIGSNTAVSPGQTAPFEILILLIHSMVRHLHSLN